MLIFHLTFSFFQYLKHIKLLILADRQPKIYVNGSGAYVGLLLFLDEHYVRKLAKYFILAYLHTISTYAAKSLHYCYTITHPKLAML